MGLTAIPVVLACIDTVVAVTAVGGGITLAAGLEARRFPDEWLRGTPFRSYLVPGLILTIVVGGSASVAAVVTWRGTGLAGWASVIAGVLLLGQIGGEILLLAQPSQPSPVEICYAVLGFLMVALGLVLVFTP